MRLDGEEHALRRLFDGWTLEPVSTIGNGRELATLAYPFLLLYFFTVVVGTLERHWSCLPSCTGIGGRWPHPAKFFHLSGRSWRHATVVVLQVGSRTLFQ